MRIEAWMTAGWTCATGAESWPRAVTPLLDPFRPDQARPDDPAGGRS